MPYMVVAANRKTPFVQFTGQSEVAAGVLTQTVHYHHHATARYAVFQRPVSDRECAAIFNF